MNVQHVGRRTGTDRTGTDRDRPRGIRRSVTSAAVMALVALLLPPRAEAQVIPPPVGVTEVAIPEPLTALPQPISISPGGAFWRALLIPGWGHAAIGSYGRGSFYFAAQSATVYTLLRTRTRIGTAQHRVRFRENVLTAQLAAEGITTPEEVALALDEDAALSKLERLLDSRNEQQEDLVALALFFLLISGADAYVSAHLARFPEPLELEARPSDLGTLDVGFRVKLPN